MILVPLLFADLDSGEAFQDRQNPPAEIMPFIKKGESLLYFTTADLNGDGLSDYLLVLESPGNSEEGNLRELVIITRQEDRSLRVEKRNSKIVMCSKCGGGWGDPFPGDIITDTNTFTVQNYGGGGSRWSEVYRFNYSRRDRKWQLVEATLSTFNIDDLHSEKTTVYKPPKDFGKIDIADFDPTSLIGVGLR